MIYLDNAATTQITEPILNAMLPYLKESYGNPSSSYDIGKKAHEAVEHAREQVARAINAEPNQIFFTSGATEANNWAVRQFKNVICSNIEHHSILNIPNIQTIRTDYFTDKVFYNNSLKYIDLVACMYVNNETGNVIDVESICEAVHEVSPTILFHSDCTAAFGKVVIDVKRLGVDSLSMSGHKFHAPKGVGILYLKEPSRYEPMLYGGNQENKLRAGTENVASIIGMGLACEMYNFTHIKHMTNKSKREKLISILREIPDMIINTDIENSVATTLNVSFKNLDGETLTILLNHNGICVGSGSACTAGTIDSSHVLRAMGVPSEYIYGTIRISFSDETTEGDLLTAAKTIKEDVRKIRGY